MCTVHFEMGTLKDFPFLKKKASKEVVTPHRLTVAILIRDYCYFRDSDTFTTLTDARMKNKYRSDFSLLILKLIQSPDLTLEELRRLMSSNKYALHPVFIISHFNATLSKLNSIGTHYLLNIVDDLNRLITVNELNTVEPTKTTVSKTSVIGYFIRRLVLSLDILTFSEVTAVLLAFRQYYTPLETMPEIDEWKRDQQNLKIQNCYTNHDQWPRRQAELFIATQTALLTTNEEKALSPSEMQKHIRSLLHSNPDLAEAHLLSYLNYLRVKEFCGAVDSLHHCFDRRTVLKVDIPSEERKEHRFAALNLAVLYYHFGHREEALASLQEAIKISQEANDDVCLQHALSWLYCLTSTNRDKLIEHSILKSLELNLSYTMSFGIQWFVWYAAKTSGVPKQMFETITKSDNINCQHNYRDLISNSYMEKSCLWLLYGKTEMSSLWSQLFLYLNTDNPVIGTSYYGEGFCQSVCNIANYLLFQGDYNLSNTLLNFAKERFPNEPFSHAWMLCENLFTFTHAMHLENWLEAEASAQKMAVIDKWESCLRLAELHLYKQDYIEAHKCVSEVLDNCQTDIKSRIRMEIYIRALILLSEIQCASSFPDSVPSGVAILLNSCLSHAVEYHLDYYVALIYLHLANVQLLLGMPAQALKLIDQSLIQILAHGGAFDRARAMLLYAKCLVANSVKDGDEERKTTILEATQLLSGVKENFKKVEAYSRIKDVLYLQAHLYNEIGFTAERNKCAMEYRIVAEDYPSKNNHVLLRFL